MSKIRLKIAYICDQSPFDRNSYSGGNARIYEALTRHAGDVTILSNDWAAADPLRKLLHALPESVNLRARWRLHLALRHSIAQGVQAELARAHYDVVFGAYSLQSIAGLKLPYPIVRAYCSDATQTIYRLSEVGRAHQRKFAFGNLFDGWIDGREADALREVDMLLWPSEWIRSAARERYALDPDRAHLVPWGANLESPPKAIPKQIGGEGPLRLLIIARDWFAKGGPVAFDTMQALRADGIDARLTVIGCVPPDHNVNDYVTVHPYLNKTVPEDLDAFTFELRRAHFLVQPSYESYGFAFCEASAYGLPSLCLRVGGVPVRDGINGHALPRGSGISAFVDVIRFYMDGPDRYVTLCQNAREEYEQRLNWDNWGTKTGALLQDAVARLPR